MSGAELCSVRGRAMESQGRSHGVSGAELWSVRGGAMECQGWSYGVSRAELWSVRRLSLPSHRIQAKLGLTSAVFSVCVSCWPRRNTDQRKPVPSFQLSVLNPSVVISSVDPFQWVYIYTSPNLVQVHIYTSPDLVQVHI